MYILPFKILHFKYSLGIGLGVVLNEIVRLFSKGDVERF